MFQSLQKQKGTLDNRPPEMFLKNKYNHLELEKISISPKETNMTSIKTKCIN